TIRNGSISGNGGGINVAAGNTLTLVNSTVSGNGASEMAVESPRRVRSR
ncbi:MAG: hypothetical protein IPG28_08785, partial [Betaproteobacteria bacterium]|nr:hypothetical protein [Betaproteobacteria bacterium]